MAEQLDQNRFPLPFTKEQSHAKVKEVIEEVLWKMGRGVAPVSRQLNSTNPTNLPSQT